MTWVIGMPFFAGYSLLLSDIRVTWGNGREDDCLQKIYPIVPFIGMGFAGSVFAGFEMLDTMRREYLRSNPRMDPRTYCSGLAAEGTATLQKDL